LNLLLPYFRLGLHFNQGEDDDFKKKFVFKTNIKGNLIMSSISSSNSLASEDRKVLSLSKQHENHGFAMCVCYCQNDKVNSIFGGGWIGYEDLIK
jgi:hypothetical protein